MRPKKIIFFDAGGTLFRPWPSVGEVYARTALKHGVIVHAEHIEKAFHEHWHKRNGMVSLQGLSSEKIERDWWYGMVRDVFSHSSSPTATGGGSMDSPPETAGNDGLFKDFDAFFTELYDLFARAECWRLFDDTVPALDHLKEAGYRMAILSNWDHRLFGIVEQLGLSGYFETVIASAAVGASKPNRKIFEAALAAMKAAPEACAHVGDSVSDDYEGARAMGLQPVLIDRSTRAYNGLTRMTALTQLPGVLQ